MMRDVAGLFLAVILFVSWSASVVVALPEVIVRPVARSETQPVPSGDDAADDPAIWIHPSSPELSIILGTDKKGGLHSYNLDGSHRQVVGEGTWPNNVDVLYAFPMGERVVDLAVASTRAEQARGLKVWAIDAQSRELADVTAGNVIKVLEDDEPYGCCTYTSARTGKIFAFVTAKSGWLAQYELRSKGGQVGAKQVRRLKVGSQIEACVADDELACVYVGEEQRGIWKFPAEPGDDSPGKLIAKVGEHGLRADVEGLTIYHATGGRGYLLASSQGNDTFMVYERDGANRFVLIIDPTRAKFGDVEDTDGIAVTSCPTSPAFPAGLLVVQDGHNAPAKQNFKLFAWEDIAGTELLVDTNCSPRRVK